MLAKMLSPRPLADPPQHGYFEISSPDLEMIP